MPVPKVKKKSVWAARNGDLVWIGAEFTLFVGFVIGLANGLLWILGISLCMMVFVGACHARFLRSQKLADSASFSGVHASFIAMFSS